MDLTPNQEKCEFIATSDRKTARATADVVQRFAVVDGQPVGNRL